MDKIQLLHEKLMKLDTTRGILAALQILFIFVNLLLVIILLLGSFVNGNNIFDYPMTIATVLFISALSGIISITDFRVWIKIKGIEKEYIQLAEENSN